jgi:hypothetical protein
MASQNDQCEKHYRADELHIFTLRPLRMAAAIQCKRYANPKTPCVCVD